MATFAAATIMLSLSVGCSSEDDPGNADGLTSEPTTTTSEAAPTTTTEPAPIDIADVVEEDPAITGPAIAACEAFGDLAPVIDTAHEPLTIEQLLAGYTINGAIQLQRSDDFGSIEVGKLADLIVVDRDITTADPATIADTKPVSIMIGGTFVSGR